MSIKNLQLCLVLVSTFKEFVEFLLRRAAQLLKLRLQTKSSLKQIFDRNILLRQKQNFLIWKYQYDVWIL